MDTLCFPVKRADHFIYPAAMFRTKLRPTHGGFDCTPVVAGRSEPAYAIEDGLIVIADHTAEPGDSSGIDVMILGKHTGIRWWYGHFAAGNVFKGQTVRKGQHIGYTGNTGNSGGAHLHLEAHYPRINMEIDPWRYLHDAPDVTGSQMPLAPSREKARELYPKYDGKAKTPLEEDDMYSEADRAQNAAMFKIVGDMMGRVKQLNTDVGAVLTEVAKVAGTDPNVMAALNRIETNVAINKWALTNGENGVRKVLSEMNNAVVPIPGAGPLAPVFLAPGEVERIATEVADEQHRRQAE